MTCIFHSFLMFHRLNNELLVLVAGLKTALHLSSPPRFQGIPEEMSSKTAPPLQFAHTLTHTHSCNSRAGTLTDTYTHFPHLSFSHFFSSLPPPLFSLSLNAPLLPLHPPPPPSSLQRAVISFHGDSWAALLLAENCSWVPFRVAAAEALFSPLL